MEWAPGKHEPSAAADMAAQEPAVDAAATQPLSGPTAVVMPRWMQAVLLPLALLGLWAVIRAAGHVVLLFTVAGLIALLLNPFVTLLRRAGLPRGPAVFVVIVLLITTVVGIGALLANPVSDQVSQLRDDVPGYIDDANAALADVQRWLDDQGIDVEIAEQGQTALSTLGKRLTEGSGDIVSFTRDALKTIVEASIALMLVVVLSIYMLLYGERIGAVVRSIVPPGDGSPEDDFPTRIQSAVFGYVRGQVLFSTIMGTSAGVLLFVLGSAGVFEEGRSYALVFGAFYGFAELIPYVGPAIGAAPPVITALFGDPLDALWLVVSFVALQQIEGHVVAPQVFAHSLRINPLLVIFALLLGGALYGFIGAFIALPIAAILRETIVYMRRHVVLEPWPALAPGGAGLGLFGVPPGVPPPTAPTAPAASPPATSTSPQTHREDAAGPDGPTEARAATAGTDQEAAGGKRTPSAAPPPRGAAAAAQPEAAMAAPAGTASASQPAATDRDAAPTRACSECGAAMRSDLRTCPACGTDVGPADAAAASASGAPG